jgi:CENP-B N-terminal DNA-binding domain
MAVSISPGRTAFTLMPSAAISRPRIHAILSLTRPRAHGDAEWARTEFERDVIRSRTGEGRPRAKARGVKMGRKPKLTAHQRAEAIRRKEGGEAVREIARSYNVHNSTISRLSI